jgi:two-component system sensor histidine kinase LytS
MSERMALVVTIAFLLTRFKVFRRILYHNITIKEKLLLTFIFGLIAIFGTYSAIEIKGALANSRVIGAVVAGLLGGPWMGAGAGLISGLHRWSLGGFTGLACGLSTFTEGLVAGLVHNRLRGRKIGWETGLITGLVAETLQMIIILLVAKPFTAALDLVKIIAAPMIIWNSIGIAIFILIVRNVQEEEERIGASQAQKALTIAEETLNILRHGLSMKTAQAAAQVIKRHTSVAAVSITDTRTILAHEGLGSDHHFPGHPVMTELTRQVLASGVIRVAQNKKEIGCSCPTCSLASAVLVPLFSREQVIGALKLYKNKENAVSPLDLEFARGLAHLFSTQLEIAALEEQGKLLKEAELQALQAQINPHFLFNALNTVISFSRSNPEMSRNLLRHLGDFFRKSILNDKKLISLAEELERIDAYLSIEKARFGPRLQVLKDIDEQTLAFLLPPLILQPLVENCVKHGILPKPEGGVVFIKSHLSDNFVKISVEDNGVGMPEETLSSCLNKARKNGGSIGLVNVNERLVNMYGRETGLIIQSAPGKGTVFSMQLPVKQQEGGLTH